ncbi:helix-turn-helix domain-containing protein [Clostridium sp.]|uniref:helix-turn-helix domain-containing protein n=1 Tax=Clostridium sp. TaxID=1506 RepID=UPI0026022BEF|nr:helix-turn-helix domain-containing protein [Clostridium sp.]
MIEKFVKEVLTVEEFSKIANISLAHTRQLLRERKINGVKVGKEWRITREESDKYLGITTDIKMVEKEIYIRELEGKVKTYEMQINTFKNIVGTLENIVGM